MHHSSPQAITKLLGLKIVSINIGGLVSKEKKQKTLINFLIKNDIDILCIQEWNKQHSSLFRDFPMYHFKEYFNVFTNKTLETAILYKTGLKINTHSMKTNKNDLLQRTWISIFSDKNVLNLSSVYFGKHGETGNLNILKNDIKNLEKINIKRKNYFMINGDFNGESELWDYNGNGSNARGEMIEDWLLDNKFTIKNNGTPTHYNTTTKRKNAIDLTLVSDNIGSMCNYWYTSEESRRDNNIISDHYYIITFISFNAIKLIDKPIISYCFENEDRYEDYIELVRQLLIGWTDYVAIYWKNIKKLNKIGNYLGDCLKYAAIRTLGTKTRSKLDSFWITKRVNLIRTEKKRFRRNLYRIKNKEGTKALELKGKINKCNKLINEAKLNALKKYQANIEDTIDNLCDTDSKYFYYLSNRAMNYTSSGIVPLREKAGSPIIAVTPKQQAEVLHNP